MSQIETYMSAKALKAVASRYRNAAAKARDPKAKRELLALAKDAQAKADKGLAHAPKAAAATLTQIALRARVTLLANKAKAARGKAKGELLRTLRDTKARIAA